MRIAVLSPFGVADGIAIYSESLFTEIAKSEDVTFLCSRDYAYMSPSNKFKYLPCWDIGGNSIKDILTAVSELAPDVLHIQLHESYLQLKATAKLIDTLVQGRCRVFVTAHNVKALGYDLAQIASALNKVEKVYSTSIADTNYLRRAGVMAAHSPLPYWQYSLLDKNPAKDKLEMTKYLPIIATHGLVNWNKGLLEMARAVALIKKEYPQALWLALNAVNPSQQVSSKVAAQLMQEIETLDIAGNVLWYQDFISSNQVVVQLLALADIGVLPYSDAGESASAAVRMFIAANLPSVISDIPQLRENSQVFKVVRNINEFSIANAVLELSRNTNAQEKQKEAMQEILSSNSWEKTANEHITAYQQALIHQH